MSCITINSSTLGLQEVSPCRENLISIHSNLSLLSLISRPFFFYYYQFMRFAH